MNAAARKTRKARAGSRPVAGIYARVSTQEQAKNGASIAAQLADGHAKAEKEGWDTIEFVDAGASGSSLNRPAIQKALQMLTEGRLDILLATSLDRIARNSHDWSGLVELGKANRWRLVTIAEDIDTGTPDGEFKALLYAAFAQQEHAKIRSRIRRGLAQKRAEGVHTGRRSTLPRELVDHVHELAGAGLGERAIATRLTNEGCWETAAGSKTWSPSAARSVLRITRVDAELPPKKSQTMEDSR